MGRPIHLKLGMAILLAGMTFGLLDVLAEALPHGVPSEDRSPGSQTGARVPALTFALHDVAAAALMDRVALWLSLTALLIGIAAILALITMAGMNEYGEWT